jgi:hypothetical protein
METDLDQDALREVAASYGWEPGEAKIILRQFFASVEERLNSGALSQADVVALFRERHLRADETYG